MKKFQIPAPVWGIIKLTVLMAIITTAFTGCKEEDDNFVAVSGISGVPTEVLVNSPLTLSATVSPSNATNQSIVWSIKDAGTTSASISGGSTLTAAFVGTVTITATIANGISKNTPFTNDFTISVKTNILVTGVTVTPETSEVPKGYALEFIATVNGNNLTEVDKDVTWTVTGGTGQGTVITADGTLTVAANETAETLTIIATSKADGSKSGTATVTVYEYQNFHEDIMKDAETLIVEYLGIERMCHYINGQYIIEGDIVIYDENFSLEPYSQNTVSTRAVMKNSTNRWDYGRIYYEFETDHQTVKSQISIAMNTIKDQTNIKFVELKTPQAKAYKKTKVVIFDSNENSSKLGMIKWNPESKDRPGQPLNLQRTATVNASVAIHELCHAIGLEHEQNRPGRDKYVDIFWHHIRVERNEKGELRDYKDQFIEIGEARFEEPKNGLDYNSIMIYDSYAFSIDNRLPTMLKKDNSTITPGNTLTNDDILVINQMYRQQDVPPDVFIYPDKGDNIHPTENSCLLAGELIYEGYPANYLTEYGICYREIGTGTWETQKATNTVNGVFTCPLGGLKSNTPYEAGAYFKFNGDTFYNLESKVEFTTQGGTSQYTQTITMTTSKSGGVTMELWGYGSASINWGDGTTETKSINPSSAIFTHNYTQTIPRTITISGNDIRELRCNNNQLTALNVNECPTLTVLECFGNLLQSLNVNGNTSLLELYCSGNQLRSLNVNGCANLINLLCSANQLTSINITSLTKLHSFSCSDNQLTSLNVSGLTELFSIVCFNNKLTGLSVNGLNKLGNVNCRGNQFSATAFNLLFESLHSNPIDNKQVWIGNNPGTSSCNKSIALNKGWWVLENEN